MMPRFTKFPALLRRDRRLLNSAMLILLVVPVAFRSLALGASDELKVGSWAAQLETSGGPLRFDLRVERVADRWAATIVNPLEDVAIPDVRVADEGRVIFRFPHYDSRIIARGEDGVLRGRFIQQRGNQPDRTMKFIARYRGDSGPVESSRASAVFEGLVGRWKVNFSESDDPAIGVFAVRKADKAAWGTFLTTTGDYRYLTAQPAQGRGVTELSVFDGAHAFLFRIRQLSPDQLSGEFWSGNHWHETFSADRDETAQLPDAFRLTTALKEVRPNELQYPDLNGQMKSLGDPQFAGRARMIQVFGSWCPNCHDAAVYLSELHQRYADKGLSIVGLAFEHSGDPQRDREMVRRYIQRHDTSYPVLLAGSSDKAVAGKQFPLLDQVRSFPTTIFLTEDGRVRAVYTGFSGPATGDAHQKLRERFEFLIEGLLAGRSGEE